MVRPSPTGQPGSGTTHRCHYRDLLHLVAFSTRQLTEQRRPARNSLQNQVWWPSAGSFVAAYGQDPGLAHFPCTLTAVSRHGVAEALTHRPH